MTACACTCACACAYACTCGRVCLFARVRVRCHGTFLAIIYETQNNQQCFRGGGVFHGFATDIRWVSMPKMLPRGAPGDAREASGTSLEGGFRKSLKNSPESDARGGHDLSPLGTLGRPSDAFRASKWIHGCLFHMFYFDSILDSCFH